MRGEDGIPVGAVIGTDDATPLDFWVAVDPKSFLQLDDVVALERHLPGMDEPVNLYGVVSQVRARQDGVRFDSDVFLAEDGILPTQVSEAANVLATRFEPEVFVPPLPGQAVNIAIGTDRNKALFFDQMDSTLPAGTSRDGQPVYLNFDFIDGSRGAHINISGVSGVATKTTYATFLLHSIFTSGVLGGKATNTKALIFNVKGEDLLFLDQANVKLKPEQAAKYDQVDLPAQAFANVNFWAPRKRGADRLVVDVGSRQTGVRPYMWSLAEFCDEEMLPYLFTDAQDERAQYTTCIANVVAQLKRATMHDSGAVTVDGVKVTRFADLIDLIADRVEDENDDRWRGRAIGMGTAQAFVRRLSSAQKHVDHLFHGEHGRSQYRIDQQSAQVTVIDIHRLNDRAQRFVVGVTLRTMFNDKESTGSRDPLTFVVLDELNKYAPAQGHSPIKDTLLDIAERGRSLGIILIGAQQTASEVERRIVSNSSVRVVGRLDAAEASRAEYAWLPPSQRQRATIIKPGTMMVSQPQLPVPLAIEFPFPAWATRSDEADMHGATDDGPVDLDAAFDGIDGQPRKRATVPADPEPEVHRDADGEEMPF